MASVPERLARIEARLEAQDEMIERNYLEGRHDRANMRMMIEGLDKKVTGLLNLFEQAKGARWLAGILLTVVAALSTVGLKSLADWLFKRL